MNNMTDKEFYEQRLEVSRRTLMELLAKVEHPYGNKLFEILVNTVNEIEVLQEEVREENN